MGPANRIDNARRDRLIAAETWRRAAPTVHAMATRAQMIRTLQAQRLMLAKVSRRELVPRTPFVTSSALDSVIASGIA